MITVTMMTLLIGQTTSSKGATMFAKGEDFGQVIREGGVQTVVYLDRSFLSGKR